MTRKAGLGVRVNVRYPCKASGKHGNAGAWLGDASRYHTTRKVGLVVRTHACLVHTATDAPVFVIHTKRVKPATAARISLLATCSNANVGCGIGCVPWALAGDLS